MWTIQGAMESSGVSYPWKPAVVCSFEVKRKQRNKLSFHWVSDANELQENKASDLIAKVSNHTLFLLILDSS